MRLLEQSHKICSKNLTPFLEKKLERLELHVIWRDSLIIAPQRLMRVNKLESLVIEMHSQLLIAMVNESHLEKQEEEKHQDGDGVAKKDIEEEKKQDGRAESDLNDSEMQRSQAKSGSTQRVNLVEQSKFS